MGKIKIGKVVRIGENARISASGSIGDNVTIWDNTVLEGRLQIGNDTIIDHGVITRGRVRIGGGNRIYPYCVIGTGPQRASFREKSTEDSLKRFGAIEIGDGNVIKEFSTIHLPTVKKKTVIGSRCYIMAYCHLAHDVEVGDGVIMANQAMLGGHVEVDSFANIGLGNQIHRYCKIGRYPMPGMGNLISKDVLPFSLINCQQFTRVNSVGLIRNKVKKSDIAGIKDLYQNEFPNLKSKTWYEKEIRKFIRKSGSGAYAPVFNEGCKS